jgi:hypothetical protein
MKYYIKLENGFISAKYQTNSETDGIEITKERYDLIPNDIWHDCRLPKYQWDGYNAIERTDTIFINIVNEYNNNQERLRIKILNGNLYEGVKKIKIKRLVQQNKIAEAFKLNGGF